MNVETREAVAVDPVEPQKILELCKSLEEFGGKGRGESEWVRRGVQIGVWKRGEKGREKERERVIESAGRAVFLLRRDLRVFILPRALLRAECMSLSQLVKHAEYHLFGNHGMDRGAF